MSAVADMQSDVAIDSGGPIAAVREYRLSSSGFAEIARSGFGNQISVAGTLLTLDLFQSGC
jgi:hypothetical protein